MTVLSLTGGLAMDLGTANTLIYRRGSGIVLNEPSLVALETETRRVLAVGREAKSYLGRTPRGLDVIRPLRCGVISDFAVAQEMIRYFLAQAGASRRLFRPKIVVGVPIGVTQLEKRAIIEAAEQAGGKDIRLVDEPMAAAIGLGLDIAAPVARLVLDVGGGTSEGVILSLGATAFSESRRLAGDQATEAIVQHLKQKFSLAVGDNMAEYLKMTIGSAKPLSEEQAVQCRGKEVATGIPKALKLTRGDLSGALDEISLAFVELVRLLISQAPPEFAADLNRDGLHLTGGGSLMAGLDQLLTLETGLKVHVPDDPLLSVVLGLGEVLENMQKYKSVFSN
ncbi:MAG: rod shape-determining protein [Candidatus Adiutrix sp.]|jgi:rod shape-determining protein MreB|nr:rod shape-determining protein [Candidatus Adiutrix sp.]